MMRLLDNFDLTLSAKINENFCACGASDVFPRVVP